MDAERMADYVKRLRVHDELALRYIIKEIYNRGFNAGYADGCLDTAIEEEDDE